MYGLTNIEMDAIYAWVSSIVGPSIQVFWTNEANIRPVKPFVSLMVIKPRRATHMPEQSYNDAKDDGTWNADFTEFFDLRCVAVSDVDADVIANNIDRSSYLNPYKENLYTQGLSCMQTIGIGSARRPIGDKFEYVSNVDFRFGSKTTVETSRGIIEHVDKIIYEP